MTDTHWICESNGKTILDKVDHNGEVTVLMLDREVLDCLEQHHKNVLIIHAEFSQPANLIAEKSFINLFKPLI